MNHGDTDYFTVGTVEVAVTSGMISLPVTMTVSLGTKELRRVKNLFSDDPPTLSSRMVVLDYTWQQSVAIMML